MDATRRFQEALAAERRMEASTQKHLLLCERVELVCDRIPTAAVEERAAGALNTLSFPQGEARGHKVMTREDDVEVMARAMEAARQCEIVADDTQALDADWGKFHNPLGARPASPSQALGRGPVRLTRFVGRMYVGELESSTPVYILLSFVNLCMSDLYRDVILFWGSSHLCCAKFLRVSCLRIQRGCECEKVS